MWILFCNKIFTECFTVNFMIKTTGMMVNLIIDNVHQCCFSVGQELTLILLIHYQYVVLVTSLVDGETW